MGLQFRGLLRRLVVDESGQDIVEYALLTAIVGLTSLVLYDAVQSTMSESYQGTIDGTRNLWIPSPPGG